MPSKRQWRPGMASEGIGITPHPRGHYITEARKQIHLHRHCYCPALPPPRGRISTLHIHVPRYASRWPRGSGEGCEATRPSGRQRRSLGSRQARSEIPTGATRGRIRSSRTFETSEKVRRAHAFLSTIDRVDGVLALPETVRARFNPYRSIPRCGPVRRRESF